MKIDVKMDLILMKRHLSCQRCILTNQDFRSLFPLFFKREHGALNIRKYNILAEQSFSILYLISYMRYQNDDKYYTWVSVTVAIYE